jgi:Domain of unknown function (DUF4115)
MADIRKQGSSGPLLMPTPPKQTNWLGYTVGVVVAVLGLSAFFALKTSNSPSAPSIPAVTAQTPAKLKSSPVPKGTKTALTPSQAAKQTQPILTPPSVTPVPTQAQPVQVAVNVAADTWVRVSADGRTVFQGVLPKGAQRNWSAKQFVKFRTGNAGGILVSHNQKAIGPLGAPGKVVERVFTKNPATPTPKSP